MRSIEWIEWWYVEWHWQTPNPDFKVTAFLKTNISKTVCFRDKLLENTNRKSKMAGRFVSVPMILSDLERPDGRNQFFLMRILITMVRSATSLHLQKCVARFVSDSWVSCWDHSSFFSQLRQYSSTSYEKPFVVRLYTSVEYWHLINISVQFTIWHQRFLGCPVVNLNLTSAWHLFILLSALEMYLLSYVTLGEHSYDLKNSRELNRCFCCSSRISRICR